MTSSPPSGSLCSPPWLHCSSDAPAHPAPGPLHTLHGRLFPKLPSGHAPSHAAHLRAIHTTPVLWALYPLLASFSFRPCGSSLHLRYAFICLFLSPMPPECPLYEDRFIHCSLPPSGADSTQEGLREYSRTESMNEWSSLDRHEGRGVTLNGVAFYVWSRGQL